MKTSASGTVVSSFYHKPIETIETGKDGKKKKKFKGSYGNLIIIDHTPGTNKEKPYLYTLYAHLDSRRVSKGNTVMQGEIIGTSGRTGTKQDFKNWKGGYHLHFEVIESNKELMWKNSENTGVAAGKYRIDPRKYFHRSFGHVFDRFVTPYNIYKPFPTNKKKKH